MKKTVVISAFPASGKTTYFNENNSDREVILDSDSSQFSWVKDADGNNTKERNPDFPLNYIQHIKENIGKVDVIFVSSHDIVRKALKDNNIPYFLVFPEKKMRVEWEYRMEKRGNDKKFISFIVDNWSKFIDDMEEETFPKKYRLNYFVNNEAITCSVMNKIMALREE